jgi:channel protein (hemolysin III family)
MISAAGIKDQQLTIIVSMMLGLPAKWVLRRFDHSAIYRLIAGVYTPFLAQMKNVLASAGLGSRALAYLQLVSRTCR